MTQNKREQSTRRATPRPMFGATPRATATQQRNTVNARLIETMIPRNGHATGHATPLQNPHATPRQDGAQP